MLVSVTITGNRETEIAGAIQSVVAHVDRVLLVDTGITDRTLELAQETAGDKLVVVQHEWVDFSAARNAALYAAENIGAKWIIIVDSDERIDFRGLNLRSELARSGVDVLRIEADDGSYSKSKIVRAGCDVRFFGPTHEELVGAKSNALLRGATFSELPKTDERFTQKITRDIELLTSFIGTHPHHPRWRLYLGLSLEALGQREAAAEAFGHCAWLSKAGDEAAWACFKQAEQLFHLDRFEEAIAAAARGLVANATFAECAWIAARSALKLEQEEQAVAWAQIAVAVGRHNGCGPERPGFRHLPALYELPYDVLRTALPTAADRANADLEFQKAKLARVRAVDRLGEHDLDWLSVSRSAPAANREEARSMLRPPTLASVCGSARSVRIQFDPPDGRLPMNPSICRHQGELWCVVRAVNFTVKGRQYTAHDPHGIVRSENYLGRLLPDGTFVDPRVMRDFDDAPRYPSKVVGYEDIRLVSIKGIRKDVLTASATVCDRLPTENRRIARLHLNKLGDVKSADVQASNQTYEKNWMPLSVRGQFAWIYSLDPTAILPGPLHGCPLQLDHLRGGAAIAFDGGYLCVTHEVIDDLPGGRVYLHRFVRLDKLFRVSAVSRSWVFAHHGIEFCAGLVHQGGQLFLSYGVEDREAWMLRVNADEVRALKWITP